MEQIILKNFNPCNVNPVYNNPKLNDNAKVNVTIICPVVVKPNGINPKRFENNIKQKSQK